MEGSIFFANVINVASTWEVVFEFVEGASHDSVSEVKGFFDSVSVVNVNVDVDDSLEGLQQFQDC